MQNEILTLTTPNINKLNKAELNGLIIAVEDAIYYFLKVEKDLTKVIKAQEINGKLIDIYYNKFIK